MMILIPQQKKVLASKSQSDTQSVNVHESDRYLGFEEKKKKTGNSKRQKASALTNTNEVNQNYSGHVSTCYLLQMYGKVSFIL